MTNKELGTSFENDFCETLFENGFWVHNLTQNASGQPADVIAARNGKTYLIDCKVCSSKGFVLSRMEENQDLSMRLWELCGNGEGWFAILIDNNVYMVTHSVVSFMRLIRYRMSKFDIKEYGTPLEKWMESCGDEE